MTLANHGVRGVGELLDATFTLYRAHFATVVTVAVLVIAPPAIVKAITPQEFARIVDLVGNLTLAIGQGAIAAIVAAAVERGEVLNVGDAFRETAGRAGSLIGAQIESGLMVLIGLVLLVIPGVIAIVWTAVSIPVVQIERLGYSKGVSRSRVLARGRFKHVLGTVLLSWGLTFLLLFGASLATGLFISNQHILDLLSEMLFALVLPVPAIAMTFLYYDLRVRNEAADLDAMIAELPAPIAEAT